MNEVRQESSSARYAKCIEVSRRIRWDIDRDVIRGRRFDPAHKFLPDGLAHVTYLPFLSSARRLLISQVQGRTYANMFRHVERFVGAKMLEVGRDHALGDQTALEAIVRFTDEELKHQELFRRIELLAADCMLDGYRWQYIVSGVIQPRFAKLLNGMVTPAQAERIGDALAPIMRRSSEVDAYVEA